MVSAFPFRPRMIPRTILDISLRHHIYQSNFLNGLSASKNGGGAIAHRKPHTSHIQAISNNTKEKFALSYLYSRCDCIQQLKSSGCIFNTLPITPPQPEQLVGTAAIVFGFFWGGGGRTPPKEYNSGQTLESLRDLILITLVNHMIHPTLGTYHAPGPNNRGEQLLTVSFRATWRSS